MRVLGIVAGVAYPFLVYVLLTLFQPRVLIVATAGMLVTRALLTRNRWRLEGATRVAVPLALIGLVLAVAAIFNDGRFFLFVPALVNLALLVGFARTLGHGPSMVETLARLHREELPESATPYCRTVTKIWALFFVLNIAVSLWLALFSTLERWVLYNGVLAYIAVAILLGGERVYRSWRFRLHDSPLLDSVVRRLLPPTAEPGPSPSRDERR